EHQTPPASAPSWQPCSSESAPSAPPDYHHSRQAIRRFRPPSRGRPQQRGGDLLAAIGQPERSCWVVGRRGESMALLTAWAPELTGPSKPQAFFSIDDLNSNPPVLLGTVIEQCSMRCAGSAGMRPSGVRKPAASWSRRKACENQPRLETAQLPGCWRPALESGYR